MNRTYLLCTVLLLLAGCVRSSVPPLASDPLLRAPVTIISGFGVADTATLGAGGLRVGGYYNFEPYDSLTITFSAKRLSLRPAFDHILIKLGPGYYVSDSLLAQQKDFSVSVKPLDLAKPRFAAFTFIVQDPEISLFLWQLRVAGWTTH